MERKKFCVYELFQPIASGGLPFFILARCLADLNLMKSKTARGMTRSHIHVLCDGSTRVFSRLLRFWQMRHLVQGSDFRRGDRTLYWALRHRSGPLPGAESPKGPGQMLDGSAKRLTTGVQRKRGSMNLLLSW